jgi:hypothetical protein
MSQVRVWSFFGAAELGRQRGRLITSSARGNSDGGIVKPMAS